MAADRPSTTPSLRWRLDRKLLVLLGIVVLWFAGAIWFWIEPELQRTFTARCTQLLDGSATSMRDLADRQTAASSQVLVDLIGHLTDARARDLADLPLAIYGRDPGQLRSTIAQQDEARRARLQGNVAVLAAETKRRADQQIAAELAHAETMQQQLAAQFGDQLGQTFLHLAVLVFSVMFLLLGVALFRFVVHPVRQLRAATQRIAAGELDTSLPPGHRDELGALTNDFEAMVVQLRHSRGELERLNRELAQEVDRKTRQLVQAEKLASLGTLAGGIAHEFNNLIGGIRGCAAEAVADETDPERRETLGVILRAADRATGITTQLLRFSKRSVEATGEHEIVAVLADALRLVEPAARRQNVTVRRTGDERCVLHCDANALHQVFVNLCQNALQAMPGGGSLTTAVHGDGDGVRIEVADTGSGIDPEDLDRVFEPFFSRRGSGTGLGLSVSYGIVLAHGGRMTVASTPGAGTTFTIWLPRLPVPGPAH